MEYYPLATKAWKKPSERQRWSMRLDKIRDALALQKLSLACSVALHFRARVFRHYLPDEVLDRAHLSMKRPLSPAELASILERLSVLIRAWTTGVLSHVPDLALIEDELAYNKQQQQIFNETRSVERATGLQRLFMTPEDDLQIDYHYTNEFGSARRVVYPVTWIAFTRRAIRVGFNHHYRTINGDEQLKYRVVDIEPHGKLRARADPRTRLLVAQPAVDYDPDSPRAKAALARARDWHRQHHAQLAQMLFPRLASTPDDSDDDADDNVTIKEEEEEGLPSLADLLSRVQPGVRRVTVKATIVIDLTKEEEEEEDDSVNSSSSSSSIIC